jgi:acetylornithine/succinyldiaminopimelate/putrescine aminotransferase
VQGEAGAIEASPGFLEALATRCRETGTLLILDEIQTGFRRTGSLMAFMQHGIVPDILVLAKGMGGGMPIGAFISSPEIMSVLSNNPALGHITTFGGHPVSCAAALAALNIVVPMDEIEIKRKSEIFRQQLQHSEILSVTGTGLLLAVEFRNEDICRRVIAKCIESGVMTDWFLFAPNKMRIAPPLIIGDHQIFMACEIILRAISEVSIPNRSPADLNH